MPAIRNLLLHLVIVSLAFIRGYTTLPTTSQVIEMNPVRTLEPTEFENAELRTEDYNIFEDSTTIAPTRVPTHGGVAQRCNYNPCVESQISCNELSVSTGCLCPGFTLHNVPPEAPSLKSVSWNGSQVIIQWCAPYSYVNAYTVTVGGQERQQFGKHQRSGALGNIEHIAEVCVLAVNDSGASDGACGMYHPTDNSLALRAGLIGGALGFLLLLLLGVLLWRHRRQRKQAASISVPDTAEMQ
ncbi:LRRN4 C-terminal-like protein [Anabas testudineus]|uniref:Fibronectin type-III domain-containing protein n=1 Tax=Anabas testudineus TaxID=64144 RepID=A0A3Q1K1T1_ANATE|nr:LRRN4 C-terminal-like protein [Anabas testudineus]XP_026226132.1 LRRN4 C-terminal-like protein [Anabas testudineus]